ncbi:MAG: HmuY family protein [Bacteroidota bacterium]
MKHIDTILLSRMKAYFMIILFALLVFSLSSCGDDDDPLPVLGASFETTGVGISGDTDEATIVITFSRATSVENSIRIEVLETGVTNQTEYSTTPGISNGELLLNVPAGQESASFTVRRLVDLIPSGTSVTFTIAEITGEPEAQISGNVEIQVSFEAITAPGSTEEPVIGGASQPNQVYYDLSLNQEITVERVSWDLGFFSGTSDKVIINYSTYALAQAIDKTDLNSVTAQDTVGFSGQQSIATVGAHIYIDNPNRDLESLAIADISATDSENKVYIINRGGGPGSDVVEPGSATNVASVSRGWKKIRILKDGDDYIVRHADIDATSFSEARITKDPTFNFNYFSFENGAVTVEPEKERWDIVFSISSNIIDFGGGLGAYGFADFVLSNRQGGVEVACIGVKRSVFGPVIDPGPGVVYDDFTVDDLDAEYVDFSADGNTIGPVWRSVFGQPTAFDDVFFVIRDTEGNIYKVQFLAITDENGTRGNTSFKYELLQ